jgi:hypothetical protein
MRYLFLMPLLLLTACAPSRDDADKKLGSACEASVKASFTDPKENITAKNASYSFEKSHEDARLRVVTLTAGYTYGDSFPDEKTYTCTYHETWSLFSWLPEFHNLQRGDEKFGNFDGTLHGDTLILAKITGANAKALH